MDIVRTAVNMSADDWIDTAGALFVKTFNFIKTVTGPNTRSGYLDQYKYIKFYKDGSVLQIIIGDDSNSTEQIVFSQPYGECNVTFFKLDNNNGAISVGAFGKYSDDIVLFFGETSNVLNNATCMGILASSAPGYDTSDFYVIDGITRATDTYTLSQCQRIETNDVTQFADLIIPATGTKFNNIFAMLMASDYQCFADMNGNKYLISYRVAMNAGSEITYAPVTEV
ncbi:MAG: hypothetical protein ACI4IN_06915 [Eubacterium sp.]